MSEPSAPAAALPEPISTTIDSPDSPVPAAPAPRRKWLGAKGGWLIFIVFTFFWLWNMINNQIVNHGVALSPNSMVFGGFGMTAAVAYTLAYRLRPSDGISIVRLGLAFVLGGLLSTQLATMIEGPLVVALGGNPQATLIGHSLAGVIEEACKIAVVILMARGLAVRTARSGLFLGGAVGLGFAAFEDMRYAWETTRGAFPTHDLFATLASITFGRDILGPFEHPVMTALLAGVLFAATRNGRFRITWRVVLVYLAVSAVHGLIDASSDLLAFTIPRATASPIGTAISLVLALGLSAVWLVYSRRHPAVEDNPAIEVHPLGLEPRTH
jgi:RsiW-degrading membrane proteinase PrsW (M82 family)